MEHRTKGSARTGRTKLTPFGQKCREIRKDRDLLLLDMALAAEVTPGFLSSVELGRKQVPEKLVGNLIKNLAIPARKAKELQTAAALSAHEFRLRISDNPGLHERELALRLERQFARMTPTKREKIMKVLEEEE